MYKENFFCNSLDFFMNEFNIKNALLADKMTKDCSYISKIRTGHYNPNEDTVSIIIKAISDEVEHLVSEQPKSMMSNVKEKYLTEFVNSKMCFTKNVISELRSSEDMLEFLKSALWNSFWIDRSNSSKKSKNESNKEKIINDKLNSEGNSSQHFTFNSVQGDVVFGDKQVVNGGNMYIYRGSKGE